MWNIKCLLHSHSRFEAAPGRSVCLSVSQHASFASSFFLYLYPHLSLLSVYLSIDLSVCLPASRALFFVRFFMLSFFFAWVSVAFSLYVLPAHPRLRASSVIGNRQLLTQVERV
jgi:hypothetical protein